MKLGIMQPYFFPYIGYWQLIHAVDIFVILDDVNYIKGGWINRNRILINGGASYITVPLQHASPNKRICDIALHPSSRWRDKLVKMIEITYRNSPCFAIAFPVVEQVIRHEANSLSEYLAHQFLRLAAFLGIDTRFVQTSGCYENSGLTSQERILDICKREVADIYINAQGGQALYSRAAFAERGVNLKFLIPSAMEYMQFGNVNIPWLSIIDVMMFNSPSEIRLMLNKFALV